MVKVCWKDAKREKRVTSPIVEIEVGPRRQVLASNPCRLPRQAAHHGCQTLRPSAFDAVLA